MCLLRHNVFVRGAVSQRLAHLVYDTVSDTHICLYGQKIFKIQITLHLIYV